MRAALLSAGNRCEVKRIARPALKSREVLIRVSHTSMSRPDLMQRRGDYPPLRGRFDPLGIELNDYRFEMRGPQSSSNNNNNNDGTFRSSSHTIMAVFAGGGYSEMAQVDEECCIIPESPPSLTKREEDNRQQLEEGRKKSLHLDNPQPSSRLSPGGESPRDSSTTSSSSSNPPKDSSRPFMTIPEVGARTREVLGRECSGTIVGLADDCERTDELRKGTRVMALLPAAGFAEYVAVDEGCVMRIPENMDFASAAAIPEAFITAYQLLETIGRVKKEDVVLIHAGGSGVGTAATQLCKIKGCREVIVTTSEKKIHACERLGATRVYDRNSSSWDSDIAALTGSHNQGGVNLILDCVGGEFLEENARLAARDTRWVLYGLLGGYAISNPDTRFLRDILCKRLTLTGSTLRTRSIEYKRELISNFARDVLPRFETGEIKPVLDKMRFSGLDKVEEGLEYLSSNASVGKVVLSVAE